MKQLLKNESFIKVLFDTIPAWVLVLDPEWRVNAVNQAARDFIGCTEEESYLNRCGSMIGCIHQKDDPRGCGFSRYCNTCIVRNTALESIQGTMTRRAKGKIEFISGKVLNVLVSSSPFEYEGQRFSVTIIEDISLIVELQGLIPICASCKRIRDDKGYWNRVEIYIEEHSEAEFTHDICPECANKLYPTLNIQLKDIKTG